MSDDNDVNVQKVVKEVEEHNLTANDLYVLSDAARRMASTRRKEESEKGPKEYASKQMGIDAYEFVLEGWGDDEQALMYIADQHLGGDYERMRDMRNRKYYFSTGVVAAFDNHVIQKTMIKEKVMDRHALKNARSIGQLVSKLYNNRTVMDKLDNFKKENTQMKQRLDVKDIRDNSFQKGFDELIAQGLVSKDQKKDVAKQLKDGGYTQKFIANELGVSVETVKKWYKEFREAEG